MAWVYDNFIMPNGRYVHGHFFTRLMEPAQGVSNYRLHQIAPESITLWIVPSPGDPATGRQSIRTVVERIQKLDAEKRIKVEVHETEAIPLSQTGKHRFTISDVGPDTAPKVLV